MKVSGNPAVHPSEPVVRPAAHDDLPAVRDLLVETWHDTYDGLIGAVKVTEITNARHSIEALAPQFALADAWFLIAEEGGRSVGHVFAHARTPPALVIARLYVSPEWQRRGIGSRLMGAALAQHPQARVMRLEVEAGNAKGLSFYRPRDSRSSESGSKPAFRTSAWRSACGRTARPRLGPPPCAAHPALYSPPQFPPGRAPCHATSERSCSPIPAASTPPSS